MRSTVNRIFIIGTLCVLAVILCACGAQTAGCSSFLAEEDFTFPSAIPASVSTENAEIQEYTVEGRENAFCEIAENHPSETPHIETVIPTAISFEPPALPVVADSACTETAAEDTVPVGTDNWDAEIPSATVHAKTGFTRQELEEDMAQIAGYVTESSPVQEAEQELVIEVNPEPEQMLIPADLDAVMAVANDYAVSTYGCVIDPTLGMGNSSYFYPAMAAADAEQDAVNRKAMDAVDFTFRRLMQQSGITPERLREAGVRCNVYAYRDGGSIFLYCLYC